MMETTSAPSFEIRCLKCGSLILFEEAVWWKPVLEDDGRTVAGIRVQLECSCGNAVGYVDMLIDGDEGECGCSG